MEDHQNPHDMIDVTDCLEARDALRGMKNFCFWMLLLSLLILQGMFWLDRADWISRGTCCNAAAVCGSVCPSASEAKPETSVPSPQVPVSVVPAKEPEKTSPSGADAPVGPIAQAAQEVAREAQAAQASQEAKEPINWVRFKLPCRCAWVLIGGLNFILLFCGVLYCLVLLITLKVSLVSRLGGISHITRAFFISLFLLVFLFPWQCLLPRVLIGVIYLPKELLCFFPAQADGSVFWLVLMYLRFVGLWVLAVWLLLWSWFRSGRWYRATQRRLGIMA
jgi:hypothetical protein